MSESALGFLKGATQKQKDGNNFWVEVFTHFMEEVDYRGLDMKFFASAAKELGKETELGMKKRFPDLDSTVEVTI